MCSEIAKSRGKGFKLVSGALAVATMLGATAASAMVREHTGQNSIGKNAESAEIDIWGAGNVVNGNTAISKLVIFGNVNTGISHNAGEIGIIGNQNDGVAPIMVALLLRS